MVDELAVITNRLRDSGATYFAGLNHHKGPVKVTLLTSSVRPASTLYRFQLEAGEQAQTVLVKIPTSREEQEAQQGRFDSSEWERPRLGKPIAGADKYKLEYQALTAIQHRFEELADPRFCVIRILDFLPEQRAIVMEFSSNTSLKRLIAQAGRPYQWWRGIPDMSQAFRHVGAWLSVYHTLPRQEQTEARQADRATFLASIDRFVDFLGQRIGDRPFFEQLARRVIPWAEATLPERLPLGLGHGDFALRNILIGQGDVVTVLDTLAHWYAPIYEDIAYFLIGLKANRPQVFSQGLAFSARQLADYERHFLAGYFHVDGDEEVPLATIRLFEIQALLDKWSSLAILVSSGRRGRLPAVQMALMNRYYRRLMDELLADGVA